MPTDFVFRLSTYLTLALSCACLGYAERKHLPEVPFIAAAVVVALVVLFRLETRIRLLAIPDANRVGLLLGLAYLVWAVARVIGRVRETGPPDLEWQLLLIAMVGPLLMVAMPAKLARREKHVGDYWWLHSAALAAAGLSGAIADDGVVFVLIGLYAACAVWSLALLHLRVAGGAVPAIPGRPASARVEGVAADTRHRRGLAPAVGLVALAAALAVPLYVLTPRSPAAKFEFGKPRVQIGYAADQMLDLNHTGELKADDRVAFRVKAERDGKPYTGLSPDQRWRGRALRRYAQGGWDRGEAPLPTVEAAVAWQPQWTGQVVHFLMPLLVVEALPRKTLAWEPPLLAPDQVALTFTVPRELPGEFLADPLVWAPGAAPPIATLTSEGPLAWRWYGDGTFYWDFQTGPADETDYTQVWHAPAEDASPPLRLIDRTPGPRVAALVLNPVERVKEYADQLVQQLIGSGRLPPDCRDRITLLPQRQYHQVIAEAFTTHLATSPRFQYTLNLRRERKDLDPVEEFLFVTKAGHCERFASALVLLLRSQGIPAVMVLGFKGCEPDGEPGSYVVRQSHAHAWVEALIQSPGAPNKPEFRDNIYRWRSYDPTPSGPTAEEAARSQGRVQQFRDRLTELYAEYFVNFTPEKRRELLRAAGNWLVRPGVLIAIGASLVAVAVAVVWRRRGGAAAGAEVPPVAVGWFAKLLTVLAAHGHRPELGQTAREFAAGVADRLRSREETAAVARVPIEWADAYYEARFGGVVPPPERLASLDHCLSELEAALGPLRDR